MKKQVYENPAAEFRAFKQNTRWYAEHWLRTGTRHPNEHFVIAAKLDGWIELVTSELREELLDELEGVR